MVNFVKVRFTRYSGYSDWTKLETNTNWQDQAFNEDAGTGLIELSAQGGNEKK